MTRPNAIPPTMIEQNPAAETRLSRRTLVVGSAVLVVVCILTGFFANALNQQLYSHHQPFHDSLGYHTRMHEVITLGQERGMWAALAHSCQCNSTVFAPHAIAAILSPWVQPTRAIGIWIQIAELAAVLLSLFFYVTCIKRQTAAVGFLMVAPVLAMTALYRFNGGLSDFRMDLSLCLLFALTMIWYLASIETLKLRFFVLFGLSAGIACLFRATAPVYLAIAFGPLILMDLALAKDLQKLVSRYFIAAGIAIGVSSWFYVLNFEHLRYYYLVWNTDAHAALPLSASMQHAKFAIEHVGDVSLMMVLVFHATIGFQRFVLNRESIIGAFRYCHQHQPVGDRCSRLPGLDFINYRLLWVAVAPSLFLVLRGAGMNPFVSMPSAIGIVLFLLLPASLPRIQLSRPLLALAAACFACLFGWAAIEADQDHAPGSINSMASHKKILVAAINDAESRQWTQPAIATLHVHTIDARTLHNVSLYDITATDRNLAKEPVKLRFVTTTSPVANANWQAIAGDSESEKIQTIFEQLNQRVQYLVVPTDKAAKFVAKHVSHNVINRYCPELRELIVSSGKWVVISEEISNGHQETVQLFRRIDSNPSPTRSHVANASH